MHSHCLTLFFATLTLGVFLAQSATAQLADRARATAPEKMMPSEKAAKLRECEKRMAEQKIKMEDRSRFVNECVWAKAK
jgi:hypothetical protein